MSGRSRAMGKNRLEPFSDAVLAIVITIMVLEMEVPHGTSLRALSPLLPVLPLVCSRHVARGVRWVVSIGVIASSATVAAAATHPVLAQDSTPVARPMDLTAATPQPLTGERRAAFEAYIAAAMLRYGVPGAAVAVVQDGELVYLRGFGVTAASGTRAVTPSTMFMIGSITKPLTTLLAANLVDHGRLTWNTRLIDLVPAFTVGDADLTERLTIRDAFCNCSGVPGRNIESYFESGTLSPDRVVTSLASVAPAAAYGEAFLYNNLLVATGGYALGVATGAGANDVGTAYDLALRERVLGPMGMSRSTFDPAVALADGDYALPHAVDLSGDLQPVPVMVERMLLPYRPAGALWSNAREMARFLQTELARGVAPGGARVASAENVEVTWAPRVAVPNFYGGPPVMAATMTRYGLGWTIGTYGGLRVISHTGGTAGFTSQLAFLPEKGVGLVVLTNALTLEPVPLALPFAVQFRLWELLFDQPPSFDAAVEQLAGSRPTAALGTVDSAAVAPYVGRYSNGDLGEVRLSLRGERLMLDVGEFSSELRPRRDGGAVVYLLHDPPLSLFAQVYGATLRLAGSGNGRRLTLTVPASVTGPEQVYAFKPVAPPRRR